MLVGWGENENHMMTKTLMQAQVPLYSAVDCGVKFQSMKNAIVSNATNLCTLDGCQGGCTGDSGGGLFCSLDEQTWSVAGIVSYGLLNCSQTMPTVYTNVAAFKDWIEQVLGAAGRNPTTTEWLTRAHIPYFSHLSSTFRRIRTGVAMQLAMSVC